MVPGMAEKGTNGVKQVCVTGAAGYIGSWLVKNLLQRGYTVNATLRDPGDETKSRPLLDLPEAQDRLKLFPADLLKDGSFDSAVEGCQGVFHVAGPMGANEHSLEDFVSSAVSGVLNIMKASTRARSVKRVVFTSSILAASPLNEKGEVAHSLLDESCWSPLNFLKSQTSPLAWYTIAKTVAEQEALKYGADNNLQVVTILPTLVAGPWLTATPYVTTARTILSLLGENDLHYKLTSFLKFTLGSMPIVHIDDTCNAHIFLMEHPNAQGRYVCSADSKSLKWLKDFLAKKFKVSPRLDEEDGIDRYVPVSSKKLLDMGFSYQYSLEQVFDDGIECAIKNGILNK